MSKPAHTTLPRVPGSPWYDGEDPPSRRDLDTCIHCGLCLTACPTYRELKIEPDSPRGRIYLMRGLADARIEPSEPMLEHLDNCLGCRACETVCPAGVPYGRMLEEARGQLNRRAVRGSPARMLGEWALKSIVAHRHRMHAVVDLLRLGQSGPIASFMRSPLAARLLPRFATQGFAMTPALAPRANRRLETLAAVLPDGARMATEGDALAFYPAGSVKANVAYFTTCVLETMFPSINRESVRLLVIAGCRVVVPQHQECCGALHAHAGLRRNAKKLASANVAAIRGEFDYIVNASAGCGAAMRDYGHLLHGDPAASAFGAKVRDVSEVLGTVGLPPAVQPLLSDRDPAAPLRIAYHDPCHLAHAQNVRAQPRALLRALPGVEVVDLADADWCCGSAGVYNLTHPEMADLQLTRKVDSIEAVAPEIVVASNPGCALHMARGARERGVNVRVQHMVEVVGRAYPAEA